MVKMNGKTSLQQDEVSVKEVLREALVRNEINKRIY